MLKGASAYGLRVVREVLSTPSTDAAASRPPAPSCLQPGPLDRKQTSPTPRAKSNRASVFRYEVPSR